MMLLSRFWYAVLAILAALAVAVVLLAVGQYNRRAQLAMTEELAGDTQVVKWAMQIDARHRIDALLIGALEKGVQDGVLAANGQDKIPAKARDDARKALFQVMEKIPADFRPDAVFAVDRDGRMVAEIGYERAQTFEDFELGGYAAVNDALHGYLRDDTWVWGGQLYRVAARPIEYDVTQAPAGAIVGIKAIDRTFAQNVSKLTRTNVLFYAAGQKTASAAREPSDEFVVDQAVPELATLDGDPQYGERGRTEVHPIGEAAGAIFQRFEGEGEAGFCVVRSKSVLAGPLAFLSGADDKDKKALTTPGAFATLGGILVLGLGLGLLFSLLEHSLPIKEMVQQAARLKKGDIDLLQLPRFRGRIRHIATDINAGIERVADKGGGAPRKAADLESILGPMPAQPAMSAFAFPMPGAADSGPVPEVPVVPPARASVPSGVPNVPPPGPRPAAPPPRPGPVVQPGPHAPAVPPSAAQRPAAGPPFVSPPGAAPAHYGAAQPPLGAAPAHYGAVQPPLGAAPAPPAGARPVAAAPTAVGSFASEEEEKTTVAVVPQDVLAAASQPNGELAEWQAVFAEFVKVKQQCKEPTEGLTFEKFKRTLEKNRDALVARHKCKRVKFTVYVKEGRASLKATPLRD